MLGPILFTIYTSRLGQIIDRYHVAKQHSAGDTQLESPCDMDEDSVKAAVKNLEHCCRDTRTWMKENRLKLYDDKNEVFLCRPSSLQKAALIEHYPGRRVINRLVSLSHALASY